MYKDFKRWVKGKLHITIIFLRSRKVIELSKLAQEAHQRFYSILFAQSRKLCRFGIQNPALINFKKKIIIRVQRKLFLWQCHSCKLKLAFTSPDIISTSPKSFSSSRIDFTLLLLFKFLKEHHLPGGQVKSRFNQPDRKIHQPWAIGQSTFFAR